MGALLVLVALILEIIDWAITRETGLWFYALVLLTVAVLLGHDRVQAIFKRT